MRSWICLLFIVNSAVADQLHKGEDWPNWRGPFYNGSAIANDLPTKFSPTENVRWKLSLPGPAGSTPIVFGDHVLLTSFDSKSGKVLGIALDRTTGKILWQHDLGKGKSETTPGMENYMACPSPVTDGKIIVFHTGRGELVALDYLGNLNWRTNIQRTYGDFNYMWGYSSSPLLLEGRLFIQILHRDEPYPEQQVAKLNPDSLFVALDASTGKELYCHLRPTDAIGETREAYSTPIPRQLNGETEIVVLGGDYVTAHKPETGQELWRYGDWNPGKKTFWRTVPCPVVVGNFVLTSAPHYGPVSAVDLSGESPHVRWSFEKRTTDTPTPLVYKNRLYILHGRRRELTCLDLESGRVLRQSRLPGQRYLRSSPTAADGKIFLMDVDGDVLVCAAHTGQEGTDQQASQQSDREVPEFELLQHTRFGGYPARSTIAIAHNQLFIRTSEAIYCIGK